MRAQGRIETRQDRTMADFFNTVLEWLSAERMLFGVPAQNWMLIIGAALVIYIAVLIVAENRHPRTNDKRQI